MFLTRMNDRIAWAPEDEAGAGVTDAAPVDAPVADAGSVLYPDDKAAGDEQATDDTTEAAEGEATEGEDKSDDPADTVPEDGNYDLKMPEGVEVDQALLDEIAPQFKELGLTTKQAQSLADKFIASQEKKANERWQNWSKTVSDWVDTAKADPEIGGAKWDSTVKTASGVVGKFGTPELKEYLNASGACNHPEMIRFMAKVGAVISEDNPAISENPGKATPRDSAAILYPDDQPKGK